jgi:hypothetical protein
MRGHRRASDVVKPFEHLHPTARSRQVGRRDEAVVAAPYDDDIHDVDVCRVVAQLR